MKETMNLTIAIITIAGFVGAGNLMSNQITLEENFEEIYYEDDSLPFNLLGEETDIVIEPVPEKTVTSDYYDMLVGQTLTEEEVLEALQGLMKSEHAVERALAVNIAGTSHINDVLFSALSDKDESVRNEAEFFTRRALLSNASFK
jgi:hypothetical protein